MRDPVPLVLKVFGLREVFIGGLRCCELAFWDGATAGLLGRFPLPARGSVLHKIPFAPYLMPRDGDSILALRVPIYITHSQSMAIKYFIVTMEPTGFAMTWRCMDSRGNANACSALVNFYSLDGESPC